tara:strand:+ start:316011 stop:317036 length:1026 start_codon:yes stop_codon:yes gene_type:complete
MTWNRALACISLVLLLIPLTAQAQRKTDIVSLYNGDRITGEIKSLAGGILTLSTDSIGTLKIEWQEVAHLESRFHYSLRLSDGSRHFGTLETSSRPGELLLQTDAGQQSLSGLQVVELQPVEDSILDRLDIYLSAGYSYTKASSVAQTTLNTSIAYEDENTRTSFTGRSTLTQTDEENTNSNRLDLSRRVWTDRSQLYRSFFASYETNDELALDYRVAAGAGLGRYFIDNNRSTLTGDTGLQVITENTVDGGEDQNIEWYIAGTFSAWRYNTPELQTDLNLNLYPNLTDRGRLRADSDLRIRWEIVSDLFWDITAFGSYDNQADSDKQYDYGITTGLGWKY